MDRPTAPHPTTTAFILSPSQSTREVLPLLLTRAGSLVALASDTELPSSKGSTSNHSQKALPDMFMFVPFPFPLSGSESMKN